jgi:hypothetical protein
MERENASVRENALQADVITYSITHLRAPIPRKEQIIWVIQESRSMLVKTRSRDKFRFNTKNYPEDRLSHKAVRSISL